jgi:hypothetical protein
MFFGKSKSKGREGKEKGRELVNGAMYVWDYVKSIKNTFNT